jgi:hypothetical protein
MRVVDGVCGAEYGSHAWGWADGQHVCARCGTTDLQGQRLKRGLLAMLAKRGWIVRR